MAEPTVDELLEQAEDLTWADPSALLLGEQAINKADFEQDAILQFRARAQTIAFAVACSQMDKALLYCAWCASHRELLDEIDNWTRFVFLWNMKMVWHGAYQFPHITLEKIDEISLQMSRLHREYGYNQRPTEFNRFSNQISTGDFEAAAESYSRFLEIPRDDMADCEACEANSQVGYLARTLRDQQALEIAKPLLYDGLACAEVPHGTYCELLKPLLRLGDRQRADEYHRTGYAKVRSNPFLLSEAAIHIGYDVYHKEYAQAVSRFERQLPIALETPELSERFCFFTVAEWLMEGMAETEGTRNLRLPGDFELFDESNRYDCSALQAWFHSQADSLADAFDARNKNDFYRTTYRSELRYETL